LYKAIPMLDVRSRFQSFKVSKSMVPAESEGTQRRSFWPTTYGANWSRFQSFKVSRSMVKTDLRDRRDVLSGRRPRADDRRRESEQVSKFQSFKVSDGFPGERGLEQVSRFRGFSGFLRVRRVIATGRRPRADDRRRES
jgi:hypothetical protein